MRLTRTPKTKGTGKYQLLSILLMLLLMIPGNFLAEPFYLMPKASERESYTCSRETAESMLSLFVEHAKGHRNGIIVSNWYLHPNGFAFQIPEGLETSSKLKRSQDVIALTDASQKNNPTKFQLSITNDDGRLQTMQREDVESVFSRNFDRFSLLSFTKVFICGVDGIRLTFLTGKSPRLQIQQCIFAKNGKIYIAQMTSENTLHALPSAWQQFDTFCSTFFFLENVS